MHPTGAFLANVFIPGHAIKRCRLEWRGGRITALTPQLQDGSSPPTGAVPGLRTLSEDSLVVPAFHDGHTHVFGLGARRLRPYLGDTSNREEALERLDSWLSQSQEETPVIGEGWDESAWSNPTPPTRRELDRLTRRPLALRRVCGHVAVFNSAALEKLGTDWPDLDLESGLARESLPLSIPRLWPPTEAEQQLAVEFGQAECLSRGVVAIHEMGDPLTWAAFRRVESKGALRLRVSHFFHSDHLDQVLSTSWEGTEQLRPAGMKFFLDGSFGGRSAWLREPYPEAETVVSARATGIPIWKDETFREAVERCFAADWAVAAHAIGDAAIDQALRTVEALGPETVPEPGFRIEHAEYLTRDLASRVEALPILLSMQPNFVARWQGRDELYEQVLGPERTRTLNPLRDACLLPQTFFGSDCMPLGPLLGLSGATDHPVPEQRLEAGDALEAYTARPARAVAQPFTTGVLRVGETADFVVLRRTGDSDRDGARRGVGADPGPGFFAEWAVAETWIGGECVYEDSVEVSDAR